MTEAGEEVATTDIIDKATGQITDKGSQLLKSGELDVLDIKNTLNVGKDTLKSFGEMTSQERFQSLFAGEGGMDSLKALMTQFSPVASGTATSMSELGAWGEGLQPGTAPSTEELYRIFSRNYGY